MTNSVQKKEISKEQTSDISTKGNESQSDSSYPTYVTFATVQDAQLLKLRVATHKLHAGNYSVENKRGHSVMLWHMDHHVDTVALTPEEFDACHFENLPIEEV